MEAEINFQINKKKSVAGGVFTVNPREHKSLYKSLQNQSAERI